MSLDLEKMLIAHVRNRDENGVNYALALGASPNACEDDGHTALIAASLYNQDAIVQILLDAGADIDRCDKFGLTPLMWAVMQGSWKTAGLLLNSDCRTDLKDHRGRTAADIAGVASKEILELIKANEMRRLERERIDVEKAAKETSSIDNIERFYSHNPQRPRRPSI